MAAARPASVNDVINEETIVQTGSASRAELTFSDDTVVRLAANTAFNFKDGTRGLNLRDGAALIQAAKGANGCVGPAKNRNIQHSPIDPPLKVEGFLKLGRSRVKPFLRTECEILLLASDL